MAVSLEFRSQSFKVVGDGVATAFTVSLIDYPFLGAPHATPSSVVVISDGGGKVTNVVLSSVSTVTLTLGSAYSGEIGPIILAVYYDII